MDDKDFAFEQVETELELVDEEVNNFSNGEGKFEHLDNGEEWQIHWDEDSRVTGIAGIAWYAYEFDDDAAVEVAE